MANQPKNKESESVFTTKFYFHSLQFTPYKDNNTMSSADILSKVITFISDQKVNGKGVIIDKHRNRPEAESRELFMNYGVFMYRDKRVRCSIALLRKGKVPMLKPKDSLDLVPLTEATGSIAEQTHFYIDYSRTPAVVCVEYNHHGPRFSDIEYYFRVVAHDHLHLSKAVSTSLYMDNTIDKTLEELKNVLNIEIKMKAENVTQMDNDAKGYISGISNLGQRLKPKFLRVEAYFQIPGTKIKTVESNQDANNMFRTFLNKFKSRPFHQELFEHFEVKYEDKEGGENIFNLMKGKSAIEKEIDMSLNPNTTQIYEMIKGDFDDFMITRFS